jgi:hypothetical protein
MIVNVHPNPQGDFDINLPFLGEAYGRNDYISSIINLGPGVTLTSNGEPNTRLESAQKLLIKKGIPVTVKIKSPRYNKEDLIFKNGYATCPTDSLQEDCKKLVDYYISVYKELEQFSQQQKDIDIFYGFKSKENNPGAYWYQYGKEMPQTNDLKHLEMYRQFEKIFQEVKKSISAKIQWKEKEVEEQLMLRINHNTPNSWSPYIEEKKTLTISHWDTSILTTWVYVTHPGAYLEINNKTIPIEELYNDKKEMLMIPGIDYCDSFETMTEPTLHCVEDQTNAEHRVGIVAFLKRKTSKD